jgi:hypothetical protein
VIRYYTVTCSGTGDAVRIVTSDFVSRHYNYFSVWHELSWLIALGHCLLRRLLDWTSDCWHLGCCSACLVHLICQSQSHIATDGQLVSKSWCRAPSGPHDQIFITVWLLRSCFCGAPSLTGEQVCLLYMLLALASAVFLRSKSLVTRDQILLSQIWDFPFRRLLRLATWSES